MSNNPPLPKKRVPAALAAILTIGFFSLGFSHLDLSDSSLLTRADWSWLDLKHRMRGNRPSGDEIIIVDIDQKSLTKLSKARQFQRGDFTPLITKLAQAEAKAVGFSIHFSEPDVDAEPDRRFAEAVRAADSVVLGFSLRSNGLGLSAAGADLDPETFGFLTVEPDSDGQLRDQPQVIEYADRLYSSIDIQLLRKYLNASAPALDYNRNGGIQAVNIGSHRIPIDAQGRLIIDHSGPRGTYKAISMIDVMEDRASPDLFKGKIVLIGTTALNLTDAVRTPFAPALPVVELHANVIDNILHKRFLYRRNSREGVIDLAIILSFGVILGCFLPVWNAKPAMLLSVLILAGFTVFNYWAFVRLHWLLGMTYPATALIVTSFFLISYRYLTQEWEGQRNKRTFQNYVDPDVVEQIMTRPGHVSLSGEKRELSVLFSDIRGFTSSSEKMAPVEVVQFLNQYFEKMQDIIWRNNGTLDKLIGDAVMCFWGAPLETKDHALRSVVTALEMTQAVEDLRGVLVLPGGAKFDIEIGVNTGAMVFGNMGPSNRFNYTVLGDSVNLGSHLESLNKHYGTKIVISESTYEQVKDLVFCRELDTIQVKGRPQAVTIYEPMGLRRLEFDRRRSKDRRGPLTVKKRIVKAFVLLVYGERRHADRRIGSARLLVTPEQEEIKTMYEHSLDLYRNGDIEGAEAGLDHVLSLEPSDGPSLLLKDRITKLHEEQAAAQNRPDPVFKFEEK